VQSSSPSRGLAPRRRAGHTPVRLDLRRRARRRPACSTSAEEQAALPRN
jgi:hypothetical protein